MSRYSFTNAPYSNLGYVRFRFKTVNCCTFETNESIYFRLQMQLNRGMRKMRLILFANEIIFEITK